MAKRLPRKGERGRSAATLYFYWKHWYNYCIVENGNGLKRFFYPILLLSFLCLLKFRNHNSKLKTTWVSKRSPVLGSAGIFAEVCLDYLSRACNDKTFLQKYDVMYFANDLNCNWWGSE